MSDANSCEIVLLGLVFFASIGVVLGHDEVFGVVVDLDGLAIGANNTSMMVEIFGQNSANVTIANDTAKFIIGLPAVNGTQQFGPFPISKPGFTAMITGTMASNKVNNVTVAANKPIKVVATTESGQGIQNHFPRLPRQ